MSTTAISRLSTQPIWVPVRIDNPITGAEDLSAATAEVAITADQDPALADFNSATLEVGTWVGPDGKDYYVVSYVVSGESLPAGSFQVWVKLTHNALPYVMRAGQLTVY